MCSDEFRLELLTDIDMLKKVFKVALLRQLGPMLRLIISI